ncbi:hypothetical protein LCGC14_1112670 [marine sediment metagenome]|uniref:Glycosyltransferase 2-like domain-containing protein n=1 Tax=marine sediment metagenome TaxID=412755 RepID=A0A0F9QCD0_9ZZZZ
MTSPFAISCVMPTTVSRWWTIPLAIECWRNQTYRDSELIIVVDGPETLPNGDHISTLWASDLRIRYHYLVGERTLGAKWNIAIKHAAYPWVALWADDDWHGPTRLERTMAAVEPGIGAVADHTCLFHELHGERLTARYTYPWDDGDKIFRYVVSGTLAFDRKLGLDTPFPSIAKGSDDFFVYDLLKKTKTALLAQPPYFYVAMCHGNNTSSYIPRLQGFPDDFDSEFKDFDGDIAEVMGGDLAKYEAAFAQTC